MGRTSTSFRLRKDLSVVRASIFLSTSVLLVCLSWGCVLDPLNVVDTSWASSKDIFPLSWECQPRVIESDSITCLVFSEGDNKQLLVRGICKFSSRARSFRPARRL